MTIADNIRLEILHDNDDSAQAVLKDAYLTLQVANGKTITGISDETSLSLLYYICYLVASKWEAIMGLESREGVKYRRPNPKIFFNLYEQELTKTITSTEGNAYAEKVSTSRYNTIDDDGTLVKSTTER